MIRNLSQKQLDVMKILWDAGTPLVASDIVKAESSMNINTVQASLRVLLKENLVEIADIVYSGTVLSRSYRPLISRDVLLTQQEAALKHPDMVMALVSGKVMNSWL